MFKEEKIISNIVVGKNPLKEAILAKVPIEQVLIINSDLEIESLCKDHKIKLDKVDRNEFYRFLKYYEVGDVVHQGVAAKINEYSYGHLDDLILMNKKRAKKPLVVILDEVTDPQNFGAIIRNCVAFDVDAIIINDKRQARVNTTVYKTSAGHAFNINIILVSNLQNAIISLKEHGFWIVSTSSHVKDDVATIDTSIPLCVIFGSEGKGVSKVLTNLADYKVRINTSPKVESLNVSVTTAIVLSQIYNKVNN